MSHVYKEDADRARERVEAWWNGAVLDRVVLQAPAPRVPGRALAADPNLDTSNWGQAEYRQHFTDPEVVVPRLRQRLREIHFGGESFPVMFPVSIGMVAITANFLGCPMRFVSSSTIWHDPIIRDWSRLPPLEYDAGNEWWLASQRLLRAAVEQADGYHVGCPDLNGPTEVLGLLRGNQELAFDLYDNPGHIKPALAKINQAWFRYWSECAAITRPTGGSFFWMGFWSDKPAIDLQSDFSCMMSSALFDEFFLPFLEEQTRMVERTVYHLDGPGAIRHLDSLLELPRLTGIQWIQGAGGGSVLQYIPLLKRIQEGRKLVSAFCEKRELPRLLEELRPEGFLPIVTDCATPEEAEEVVRLAARKGKR